MLNRFKFRQATLQTRRRSKGVTLLELAMYLGIAGIIAAGVMTYYSSSSNAQKVTDTLSMLGSVQQTVRALSAGQADFEGITTALVAGSNQLPRKFIRTGGATMTNPFNGDTTIDVATAGNARFAVIMTGLPRDACTKLAVADLGPGMSQVVAAADDAAVPSATLPTSAAIRITATAANTACSGTTNSIAWEFF